MAETILSAIDAALAKTEPPRFVEIENISLRRKLSDATASYQTHQLEGRDILALGIEKLCEGHYSGVPPAQLARDFVRTWIPGDEIEQAISIWDGYQKVMGEVAKFSHQAAILHHQTQRDAHLANPELATVPRTGLEQVKIDFRVHRQALMSRFILDNTAELNRLKAVILDALINGLREFITGQLESEFALAAMFNVSFVPSATALALGRLLANFFGERNTLARSEGEKINPNSGFFALGVVAEVQKALDRPGV